ncbi:L-rhamnose/proton symporter RhaT [Flagellimonas amoyensis]|uniref:L-rhamnose/proton symporter RhaT n=1 Tax=Flagellimonas amoyensis TaxID=2169401 RepID=UPI000D350897|nr:L-rhamnose/proton symporter RhaT [Allomuricauda amoyensis]
MGSLIGLFLHAIGGFAAGSFYMPFKLIKKWQWESSWLVLGVAAWILTPMFVAWLTLPNLFEVFNASPWDAKLYAFLFGVLWGIGGLTFGLSMRYLGMSLGMGIALGFTAAFGTLIPPIYDGRILDLVQTKGGLFTLAGVAICLFGISITGKAGILKEKELNDDEKQTSVPDYNLKKGIVIAIISGILSACFAFGLQAGKPIADKAVEYGTTDIFMNNGILVWILWGGFATNFIWTAILSIRKGSYRDFYDPKNNRKTRNYLLAAAGGITWYFQFFFYGMGATFLGEEFEFASWTLHISFILFFSTMWGIIFKEWKGVSKKTMLTLGLGLVIILLATILISLGNNV